MKFGARRPQHPVMEDYMELRTVSRKFADQAIRGAAVLMMLANVLGIFGLWQPASCWAQQYVPVYPGQNLQALVNQYPSGTTFTFTPGIYYSQSITPHSYDTFIGQPGAILSGATLLQNFNQNGSYWTSHVQVYQASYYPGGCGSSNPICML